MFRVLELGPSGRIEIFTGGEQVAPPPEGTLRWVDLRGQDHAQLEILRQRFDFHPLALEDCAHLDQRPKLEEYRDSLFLVTQGFSCPHACIHELELHELHAFLGTRFLVTVHLDPITALDDTWKRLTTDPALAGRGPAFWYYLIADELVDHNFPLLDKVTDELEQIEDAVLTRARRQDLARIFELKRHLVTMRKVLSPQRDVFSILAKRGDPRVDERTALYFRDVYDHLARINESIEANRDILGNALDAYLSSVSNRTNEIMKYLTIMSAVFLPLTFIVGFFGQNFDNLPGFSGWMRADGLMYGMLAACLATPVGMYLWFKRKQWL